MIPVKEKIVQPAIEWPQQVGDTINDDVWDLVLDVRDIIWFRVSGVRDCVSTQIRKPG